MVDENDFANILKADAYGQFAVRQTEAVDAVPSPFPTLNRESKGDGGRQGLAYGWHVVVAGATNMGKTNLALNLACHAVQEGHAVMFLSLEMARHQIQGRVYSILSGEDSDRFARGSFSNKMVPVLHKMDEGVTVSGGLPPLMLVNDRPIRNIYTIAKELEGFREAYNCRMFLVDYLQLCETGSDDDRRRQVAEISASLMTYAHQYGALTIGLSQLNRFTTKNRDASPEVEGMTESSSLENDADMVLLLDHSKYEKDVARPWLHRTWIKIGKNRHGGKGLIPIEWNWKNYRCREALPDEVGQWPGADKLLAKP